MFVGPRRTIDRSSTLRKRSAWSSSRRITLRSFSSSVDQHPAVLPSFESSPGKPANGHSSKPSSSSSKIRSLLNLNHILYDPIRIPRYPIVLCHGLYGFAVRGPSSFPRFQIHYWGKLLGILRHRFGVKVIIGKVPPTGTIEERAGHLDRLLESEAKTKPHQHAQFNLIAHSMGGLDARYLISRIRPKSYSPLSLTTICTPHRGSPFMDWCRANIGVGLRPSEEAWKPVPFSLKEPLLRPTLDQIGYLPNNLLKVLLLNIIDSPAYSNLSTDYLENQFNPATPDLEAVKYFSIAAKIPKDGLSIIHPLWLPGLLLDKLGGPQQGGHDGLVTVESAKWGDFLGVVDETDHWEIRGSSAFGSSLHEPDGLINQHAKSNWLELNRYIGSWLSSSSSSGKSMPANEEDPTKINRKIQHDDQRQSTEPKKQTTNSDSHSHHRHQRSESQKIQDQQSLSTRALADWIAKKLPLSLHQPRRDSYTISGLESGRRTIDPGFPLDDLPLGPADRSLTSDHQQTDKSKFDLEKFYLAVCRNLHDHGL